MAIYFNKSSVSAFRFLSNRRLFRTEVINECGCRLLTKTDKHGSKSYFTSAAVQISEDLLSLDPKGQVHFDETFKKNSTVCKEATPIRQVEIPDYGKFPIQEPDYPYKPSSLTFKGLDSSFPCVARA